jgi:hypothetical protein
LVLIENFALYLAGLEHILGQRLEDGLLPQGEPECLHPTNKPSLPVPDGGQLPG